MKAALLVMAAILTVATIRMSQASNPENKNSHSKTENSKEIIIDSLELKNSLEVKSFRKIAE